jgi:hypothetical protein
MLAGHVAPACLTLVTLSAHSTACGDPLFPCSLTQLQCSAGTIATHYHAVTYYNSFLAQTLNSYLQDMKHLDPCLASALGRTILQHLPPDALATLLGSDQLALLSENTTLAAIDVWLAGPVAASLAAVNKAAGDTAAASPERDAYDMAECSSGGGGSRLAAALQLLVRQVRLPLCSGAFLAAAVSQRPWLCLGMQGWHELGLMKQYYR